MRVVPGGVAPPASAHMCKRIDMTKPFAILWRSRVAENVENRVNPGRSPFF